MKLKYLFVSKIIFVLVNNNIFSSNTQATMIRVIPSAAINFTSHEQYKHLLGVDIPNSEATPYKRFLAGSLAGLTAVLLTYPLDLARARMAVTDKHQFANIVGIFSNLYKKEGLRGFYRGYLPTLIGALPYAGCGYYFYETFKIAHRHREQREPNPIERIVYGACAGAFSQTISYPFDVIRRRFQTATVLLNGAETDLSMVAVFRKILHNEGIIHGFYKGLSINWIKGPVAAGVGFMTYDVSQLFIRNSYIHFYHS
jgi:solute carrier family 25 protein 42